MPTQSRTDLRNVAIVAHVDHGKTTLVDQMLRQAGAFTAHQAESVADRVMDSGDLEREKGITILAKNTAVHYAGPAGGGQPMVINIIDTPGHADFGGEVERGLSMVDGIVLLVDASEGPLPQTRFVLRKALNADMPVILVVNKTDRSDARIAEVVEETYELFMDLLDESHSQDALDFPVVYASGRAGIASLVAPEDGTMPEGSDLEPLFKTILETIPAPVYTEGAPLQAHVTNLDASPFLGRLALVRVHEGTLNKGQTVAWMRRDGSVKNVKITELLITEGLERQPGKSAGPGDIVAVAGIPDITIGETLADAENPVALPLIHVDEPAISMTIGTNTSPLVGRTKGGKVTARLVKDRLDQELVGNVSLRILPTERPDAWEVQGRGELALAILVEQMRREGFELTVGKPQVVTKLVNGKVHEPFERLTIDAPEEYLGTITELLASRKGRMESDDQPRHRLGPDGVPGARAWPDRLPHRVPHRHPRHRHRARHLRGLRALGRRDPLAHQRLARRGPQGCGDGVRHDQPAGARDHVPRADHRGLRGHDHRRELARRRHGRQHHQGEAADQHPVRHLRQLREAHPAASPVARAVPGVLPRRRVRRGHAGRRTHPQGRARRQRPRQDRVAVAQGQQVVGLSDPLDLPDPPGDDLAGRLASWLEELGLADQLAAAGLPTYERDVDGAVQWRDPSGEPLTTERLTELDGLLRAQGDDPAHAVPVALVRLRRESRVRAELLDGGWLDYAGVGRLRGVSENAARFAVHKAAERRAVLLVAHEGATLVPSFQLDADGQVREELLGVIEPLLAGGVDPWRAWVWLSTPAGLLGGAVPHEAARDPEEVPLVQRAAVALAERARASKA
jgi:GTP-binding protein